MDSCGDTFTEVLPKDLDEFECKINSTYLSIHSSLEKAKETRSHHLTPGSWQVLVLGFLIKVRQESIGKHNLVHEHDIHSCLIVDETGAKTTSTAY